MGMKKTNIFIAENIGLKKIDTLVEFLIFQHVQLLTTSTIASFFAGQTTLSSGYL